MSKYITEKPSFEELCSIRDKANIEVEELV